MSWVTFGDVDFMDKSLLRGNVIPFYEQEISTPFAGINLFIPDTYLQKVVVNTGVKYKQVETNMPGFLAMVEVETTVIIPDANKDVAKVSDSEYEVLFYDSTSDKNISEDSKRKFKEVLEKFTVVIGKNIKVGVPHKKLKDAPGSDSKYFYIYIWSQVTTNTLGFSFTPHTMWEIPVSCTDNSYLPSGKGMAIITNESHCAAELVGNALYIHHDICHKNTQDEIILFERIVKEAFLLYKMSAEELEAYKKEQIILANKRAKEAFSLYFSTQMKNKITSTVKNICNNESSIDSLQREIINLVGINKEQSDFLLFAEEKLKKLDISTMEEYEKLTKIDKVLRIDISNGTLIIETKPIYIKNKDLRGKEVIYFIGAFKISMTTQGKIVFYNLSNAGKGPGYTLPEGFTANAEYNRHHPHINSEGRACLGNLSSVVAKYLSDCQISVLVTLLIKFLETVDNTDHAGRGIYWWPIVSDEI